MGLVPEFGTRFGYVRKSQGNVSETQTQNVSSSPRCDFSGCQSEMEEGESGREDESVMG